MSDDEKTPIVTSETSSSTERRNLFYGTNNIINNEKSEGSCVTFHNINYTMPIKKGKCCFGTTVNKVILNNVSGTMKAGMNAILGPTGSGKSSLLDVLAGRKDPQYLKGTVLIDGHKQPENFQCISGYVVQDDVVMGTLTIRENFNFSASLRLSNKISPLERKNRINDVVNELGLNNCADIKVGNEFIRGVSGGERKRCNIGMELIIKPQVLFLDEPTTGLDASTANAVMMLLHKLSRAGRTIIFAIHQPRYSIFKLFDSLMLLSLGNVVYHGPSEDALSYFELLGYQCEAHNNPPDFFLDVINGDSTAVLATQQPGQSSLKSTSIVSEDSNASNENRNSDKLVNAYNNSAQYKSLLNEIQPVFDEYQQRCDVGPDVALVKGFYATSFCSQLRVVCKRTILNLIRNPQTGVLQIFTMIIFALIVGLLYLQIASDLKTGVQNRVGAFFFLIINMMFGNLSAVELFINERKIFQHENSSGYYRVSAYFLAKFFCDVIPMRTIPVVFFSVVSYWMIGFEPAIDKFLIFMLTLVSTTLAASALAFFISASVKIYAIASLLIALNYVFMMVFGGMLINMTSLPKWNAWIKYYSIFRYGLTSLSINELKDKEFCSGNGSNKTCSKVGNDYLDAQGIPYSTSWDLWQNIVAMGSMTVIFLVLCYIQLRRMNKYK